MTNAAKKENARIRRVAKFLYAASTFKTLAMQQAMHAAANEAMEILVDGELRAQLESGLISYPEYAMAIVHLQCRIDVEIGVLREQEEMAKQGIALDEATGQPVSDYPRIVA